MIRTLLRRRRQHRDDAPARAFYHALAPASALVYDVGANRGDKAALYRRLGYRVVAIEPQPGVFDDLQERFARDRRTTTLAVAAGAAPGTATLHICSAAPTISTLSDAWQQGRFGDDYTWDQTARVPVVPLSALFAEHGVPRYLKIDVEGFEHDVLAGLPAPLAPGTVLSLEYTAEGRAQAHRCLDRLLELGATAFALTHGETLKLDPAAWETDADAFRRRFDDALDRDPLQWGDLYARC